MTCQPPGGLKLALEMTRSGVTAGHSQLTSHPPPTAQAAHMTRRQHLSWLREPSALSVLPVPRGNTATWLEG